MTGAQMPSAGRALEGTLAVIGCGVVLAVHGVKAAKATPRRVVTWLGSRRTFSDWLTDTLDRWKVGDVSGPGDDE